MSSEDRLGSKSIVETIPQTEQNNELRHLAALNAFKRKTDDKLTHLQYTMKVSEENNKRRHLAILDALKSLGKTVNDKTDDKFTVLAETIKMVKAADDNNERRHLAALNAFTKAANLENHFLAHKADNFGPWKDHGDFTYTTCCWSINPDQPLLFHGAFTYVDHNENRVFCTTSPEVLRAYPRGAALVSLLCDRTFAGVEAFAVAVENALGEDVTTVLLDGKINRPSAS